MRRRVTAALLPIALGLLSVGGVAQMSPEQNEGAIKITQGPKVESTTGNTATIAWSTDVASSTVVKYGTDQNNLSQTAQTPWGGLTHRVVIKGLQPNTTYYYKVDSGQAAGTGTSVASNMEQFQTRAESPSAQSASGLDDVLAGPVVQDLTPSAATLWWHSDQSSPSQVKYGLSQSSLDKATADWGGSTDHKAQLTGLEAGKTYYFAVTKSDGSTLTTGQFSTPQQEAASDVKITNGPVIEFVGHNHAIVAWSTSAPASTIVRYGTDPNALSQTAQGSWGSTTHRVDVKNLHPNTKYYFEVVSNQAQGAGTLAQSASGQFHTVGQGQQSLALSPQH